MKPENRDPYIMSPAAETGKKITSREIGVPYLPADGLDTNESVEFVYGNDKRKKVLKIAGIVVLVLLFVGLGVVCLTDTPSDLFKIQPPAGIW